MTNEYTVLIVDDSPADLQLVLNVVKEHFKVLAATSGKQAISMVEKAKPNLVLLDVSMPEMDGYQTCEEIKAIHPNTLIVFLSANDSTEEILRGYDVGGADYVIKPFEPDVLINKLNAAFDNQQKEQELKQEADYASEVAMAAISSSSELSTVVNFLRESFNAKELDTLSKLVSQCLEGYGLTGSIQFRAAEKTFNYAMSGAVTSLEEELLFRIAVMPERILEKGHRMFLNFDNVSLLIKNIPLEDPDKIGRLRDYLMILIEGANEKVELFDAQVTAVQQRNDSYSLVINKVKESLKFVHQAQKEIEKQNVDILDTLADDVDEAFIGLGLSEDQEEQIMSLLKKAITESSQVFEKGVAVDQTMKDVLEQVAKLKEHI